ncbi:MAG: hypothetical protein KUG75_04755 [Pseudomonadales bacterium]|nr:hypothetical protein [Pseudomonadales bacterium]
MRYVNGIIAFVLLAFAVVGFVGPAEIHLPLSLFAGAILALLSMQRFIGLMTARALAVTTVVAMFFFFAGFFKHCPALSAEWYLEDHSLDFIGLLFAGFAMIPVLSVFSCWMKAECHMRVSSKSSVLPHSHTRKHQIG